MRTRLSAMTLICVALVGISVMAYSHVIHCDFVNLDDPDYVFNNHGLLASFSLDAWKRICTGIVCANWHPLTAVSLGIDDCLWGLEPGGYHATNLALHCLNVLLIFGVLARMTGCVVPALCVAAVFAVHPLHVESVAWVSERKDVLSTLFLLLTIWAYDEYARRPALMRYALVFVLMMCGLLAKPMLVTLPILLLLLDAWPLNRIQGFSVAGCSDRCPQRSLISLLIEKLPLLGLSFADGLITIFAQGDSKNGLPNLGLSTRIGHLFYSYYWYLEKTIVPINLTVYYPHPQQTLSWSSVGLGAVVFSVISLYVLWQIKNKPHLAFGWLWFVIALLPVIGILQVGTQAYADRYSYIPHIGLFAALFWEAWLWAKAAPWTRAAGAVVMIGVIGELGFLCHTQVNYWTSCRTLWTHALQVNPDNGLAYLSMANFLVTQHKYAEALPYFEPGLQLALHNFSNGYFEWGQCLEETGHPAEAETQYLQALKINRNHMLAFQALCKLLLKQERYADVARASEYFGHSVATGELADANDYRVEIGAGLQLIQRRMIKEALVHFERAVTLAPTSAAALNNLATAQLDLGQLKSAKENFSKALERNPGLSDAHFNLAAILETEGDREGARQHYAEAYRINPQDLEAKQRMERLSTQR